MRHNTTTFVRAVATIAVATLCAACAVAQISAPVTVRLLLSPNPSPRLSDWQMRRETASLTVINPGAPFTGSFDVKVMNGSTIDAYTDLASMPSVAFPTGAATYQADQLFPGGAVKFSGGIDRIAATTGMLPEGDYQVCATVVTRSGSELGPPSCADFSVAVAEPPVLVTPEDESKISVNQLPNTMFSWLPSTPSSMPVQYHLVIVEVLPNQPPSVALAQNPAVWSTDVTGQQALLPQFNAHDFTPGATFAWSVQVGASGATQGAAAIPFQFTTVPESLSALSTSATLSNGSTPTQHLTLPGKLPDTSCAPCDSLKSISISCATALATDRANNSQAHSQLLLASSACAYWRRHYDSLKVIHDSLRTIVTQQMHLRDSLTNIATHVCEEYHDLDYRLRNSFEGDIMKRAKVVEAAHQHCLELQREIWASWDIDLRVSRFEAEHIDSAYRVSWDSMMAAIYNDSVPASRATFNTQWDAERDSTNYIFAQAEYDSCCNRYHRLIALRTSIPSQKTSATKTEQQLHHDDPGISQTTAPGTYAPNEGANKKQEDKLKTEIQDAQNRAKNDAKQSENEATSAQQAANGGDLNSAENHSTSAASKLQESHSAEHERDSLIAALKQAEDNRHWAEQWDKEKKEHAAQNATRNQQGDTTVAIAGAQPYPQPVPITNGDQAASGSFYALKGASQLAMESGDPCKCKLLQGATGSYGGFRSFIQQLGTAVIFTPLQVVTGGGIGLDIAQELFGAMFGGDDLGERAKGLLVNWIKDKVVSGAVGAVVKDEDNAEQAEGLANNAIDQLNNTAKQGNLVAFGWDGENPLADCGNGRTPVHVHVQGVLNRANGQAAIVITDLDKKCPPVVITYRLRADGTVDSNTIEIH